MKIPRLFPVLGLLCLLFPPVTSAEVVRVLDFSPEQAVQLRYMGDFWGVDRPDGAAVLQVTEAGRRALEDAGFRVETDVRRTASVAFYRQVDRDAWVAAGLGGIPGFPCYRTVSETHADLEKLAQDHPDLARWEVIGETWQRQNSDNGSAGDLIHALVIGRKDSPHDQAPMLVIAAQHARELTTAEIATRFAEHLVENYETDPTARWLLDHRRIHVVAQQNPDGRRQVETTENMWRKNQNTDACPQPEMFWDWTGVDLNRNHSANYVEPGSGTNPCSQVYQGTAAGSEPESQAIEAYMEKVFQRQRTPGDSDPAPLDAQGVFLSLHSFGEMMLVPWDGRPPGAQFNAPNHDELMVLGRKLGFYTDYETARPAEILYAAGGTTTDYAYNEFGVAAYTPEIGTDFLQTCGSFEDGIYQDNLNALLYAAKAADQPYRTPWGPEITQLSASWTPDGSVQLQGVADDDRYYAPLPDQLPAENPTHGVSMVVASLDVPPHLAEETFELEVSPNGYTADFSGAIPVGESSAPRRLVFVTAMDAAGNPGVTEATFFDLPQVFDDRFEVVDSARL